MRKICYRVDFISPVIAWGVAILVADFYAGRGEMVVILWGVFMLFVGFVTQLLKTVIFIARKVQNRFPVHLKIHWANTILCVIFAIFMGGVIWLAPIVNAVLGIYANSIRQKF